MLGGMSTKDMLKIMIEGKFKNMDDEFKSTNKPIRKIIITANPKSKILGESIEIEFKDIVDEIKEIAQDIFECCVLVISTDYIVNDNVMYVFPDYQEEILVKFPADYVGDDFMIKDKTLYSFHMNHDAVINPVD